MASFLTPGAPRTSKNRISTLPTYSSAVYEKSHLTNGNGNGPGPGNGFFTTFYVPLPGASGRRPPIPVTVPAPQRMYAHATSRFGRRRGCAVLLLAIVAALWTMFALAKRFGTHEKQWPTPFQSDSTLVFQRADLRSVYEWEIRSGHYPSNHRRECLPFILFSRLSRLLFVLKSTLTFCFFPLVAAISSGPDRHDSGD